jgi:hypothetical protein
MFFNTILGKFSHDLAIDLGTAEIIKTTIGNCHISIKPFPLTLMGLFPILRSLQTKFYHLTKISFNGKWKWHGGEIKHGGELR